MKYCCNEQVLIPKPWLYSWQWWWWWWWWWVKTNNVGSYIRHGKAFPGINNMSSWLT